MHMLITFFYSLTVIYLKYISVSNILLFFREHKKSMTNLRKLLNKSSIIRRNRRVLLNIQITIVAWSLEFVGSIFGALMFWMPFESQTSRIFQLLTSAIYFVMIPSIYLVNGDEAKSTIMESNNVIKIFIYLHRIFRS